MILRSLSSSSPSVPALASGGPRWWQRLALGAVVALGALSGACRDTDAPATPDAGLEADAATDYPAPRTDLVPSVGSAETLEFATWNIENFPKNESTPRILADLIASLDLDLITLQEVEDIAGFDELVARLPGYEGLLSSHTYGNGEYQKLGYIYRSELISLSGGALLFSQDGYIFPRPPFKVDVNVNNGSTAFTFTAIALHLKAGTGFDDKDRREQAVVALEEYVRSTVDGNGIKEIALFGDFNDTLNRGAAVFAPLTASSDRYTIRTQSLADGGSYSFIPSGGLIDHVVTTADFGDELEGAQTIIPQLDSQLVGYVATISDHLPVIVKVPL